VLVLAGLATGHKIGIAVVAAVFVAFALFSSFVAPKRWPEFPGRNGLSVFMLASFALFAAMLTTIVVLAVEKEEGEAHAAAGNEAAHKTIEVKETEFKIELPSTSEVPPGKYTFVVHNEGQAEHDLVVEGPNVAGESKTPLIQAGQEAKLDASLATGTYTLYCSVDDHRKLGMVAKLLVG
jgi:plastocyanin